MNKYLYNTKESLYLLQLTKDQSCTIYH